MNEALRIQGRLVEAGLKPIPPLGTILMKRGHLTRDALATALEVQNFMLYRCSECESRVGISPGSRGGVPVCPACKQEVPPLFSKMASAIHQVLEEAAGKHAFELPDEVVLAAEKPNRDFGKYLLVRLVGRGGAGEVCGRGRRMSGGSWRSRSFPAIRVRPRDPRRPSANPRP